MKIHAIVTGATGMVGEGVLHECLLHPEVERVLVIGRKPCGLVHAKLKEIIHKDFHNLTAIQDLMAGYNACFFCLGVSSVGLNEERYRHLTYDLTLHFAETLTRVEKGMVFNYVSGSGTDSTERGKVMWARVKGKTENDLMKLAFRKTYMFRPGLMKPTKGLKNTLKLYAVLGWTYPLVKKLFPRFACSLKEVGIAMINSVNKGPEKSVLEVPDIIALSKL